MLSDLVEFKNDYFCNTITEEEGDTMAQITIDGFPMVTEEEEEGRVVATVLLSTSGDILVNWHDNGYRMHEECLELIKEAKEQLREYWAENWEKEYHTLFQQLLTIDEEIKNCAGWPAGKEQKLKAKRKIQEAMYMALGKVLENGGNNK